MIIIWNIKGMHRNNQSHDVIMRRPRPHSRSHRASHHPHREELRYKNTNTRSILFPPGTKNASSKTTSHMTIQASTGNDLGAGLYII